MPYTANGWTIYYYKVQDRNIIDVWFNHLKMCHPTYDDISTFAKIPISQYDEPAFILAIDNDNKKIGIGYASYYNDGADEWYQLPFDSWMNNVDKYLVTVAKENGVISGKYLLRLYRINGDLTNDGVITWDSLVYLGDNPGLSVWDGTNGKLMYDYALTPIPVVVAAIVIAAIAGASVIGVSYFDKEKKKYEAKEAEYTYLAELYRQQTISIVSRSVDKIVGSARECSNPDYCMKIANTALNTIGTAIGQSLTVNNTSENEGWMDKLKDAGSTILQIGSIVGILFLVLKFDILKTIMDRMKEMFSR